MFTKILAGLATMAVSQTALATDWQYCLAPSDIEYKVYLSGVFATREVSRSTDDSFKQMLFTKGLRHDVVQCPRADSENAIMTMLRDAVAYNQRIGRQIVYLYWEPTR
jgi:hypothetical protein